MARGISSGYEPQGVGSTYCDVSAPVTGPSPASDGESHLALLHAEIRACRRCVERGLLAAARPVAAGEYVFAAALSTAAYRGPLGTGRVMLIGQAPGHVEAATGVPFSGRAGRALFRWLGGIGLDEATFRRHVYISAVTRCFPGKSRAGGDRRPTLEEARLCRPFLDRQMALLDPRLVILVGKMAIDLHLPGQPLGQLVGQTFQANGREFLPLPHPSGASRWPHEPANKERLRQALGLLRERLAPLLDGR